MIARWSIRAYACAALLLGWLACSGCARWDQWNPRGEGFEGSSFKEWGGYERPRDSGTGTGPFGFSEKAREIERDLGVY